MSNYQPHRQDWEEVRIKKRIPKNSTEQKTEQKTRDKNEPRTVLRNTSPNASSTMKVSKSVLNDSADPETLPTVLMTNDSLSTAMKKARNAKIMPNGLPMTQTDLDKAAQVPKNTVRDYENGSAVYNSDHVNKIAQALGVTLPRPKRQKA